MCIDIHRLRPLLIFLVAISVSGCESLPGFSRADYEKESRWYGSVEKEEEDELDFDPEVHKITPGLIERLNSNPVEVPVHFQALPENIPAAPYTIGIGDLLGVVVYGHPDITNPAGLTQTFESSGRVVDAEGKIFIPFAGALHVAGLTTSEARQLVSRELRRVIKDPQVDVRVLNFRSKRVYVTGDISQPCTVWIEDIPLTIVDALKACGSESAGPESFTESIDSVRLLRNGRSYPINLSVLYRTGGGPVTLQDGDRLIVDSRLNRVFVIGEFETQMAVSLSAGEMTLADAMAAAGGLDLDNADTSAIYVIRGQVSTEKDDSGNVGLVLLPVVYHLNATEVDTLILADQFRLQPRDVVYAAPASLVNFNRALAQILPSIDALFRTTIIYDRLRD